MFLLYFSVICIYYFYNKKGKNLPKKVNLWCEVNSETSKMILM